jgi:hypothetical protein
MVSSGMLRRVALVRTDVSEELSASFIRVTRIGELGTTLAATSKSVASCCYGDNVTLLYVDDVRISQETHLWASTVCYSNSLNSFMYR